MKYLGSGGFTALGSESNTYTHARAVCSTAGHMEPDVRGKCLRCGEPAIAAVDSPVTSGRLMYVRPDLGMGS